MQVSYFNNVSDTLPKDYDLDKWLQETINPPKEVLKKVNKYRSTFDKGDKSKLPCVTISASFDGYRNLDNIKSKNNFLCIDIDRNGKKRSNLCIDMLLVKEMFMNHPCTYYCGYSVSGDGIYALIRIYDKNNLDKYFNHFQEKFSKIGINIDPICKDYTRLRFFSYDPEAYYNPNAKYYKIKEVKKISSVYFSGSNVSEYDRVGVLISEIERLGIDITSDYNDWIKIGSVLNNNFGESGRNYFHRLSRFHCDYDSKKVDSKYDKCSKMNVSSIGLIVNICKDYGIM